MLLLAIRTLLLYFILIIALRIMGKRELGQLQPFEFVIILLISEMASSSLQYTGIPLLNSLTPIVILCILQIFLAMLCLNFPKLRKLISGTPSVLVENGIINEKELRKQRLNCNDLLELLRNKGFFNINDVEYAVLETTGQISIMAKSNKRPLTSEDLEINSPKEKPVTIIILDGKPNNILTNNSPYNLNWLKNNIGRYGIKNINQIFFASVDEQGNLFCQIKASEKINKSNINIKGGKNEK